MLTACGAGALAPAEQAPAEAPAATPRGSIARVAEANQGQVIVGDVLDHQLTSDEWPGSFGSVTFKLHEGRHNSEPIYFIRTDASEAAFAEENRLVFVPLLNAGRDVAASLYLFDGDQPPVLSASPGDEENFTSLFHIKNVTGDSGSFDLVDALQSAAADGQVTIEESNIFVNYPVVKWSGGELAAMAPMMSIPASPPNAALMETGATDEIWVFGNGIAGSGVMGFQPAIFDNKAGEAAWSPFWNHFTVTWSDEGSARVLNSSAEIRELVESGDLELFNGVPDSHPTGFVVNCPVPVLADNTFSA